MDKIDQLLTELNEVAYKVAQNEVGMPLHQFSILSAPELEIPTWLIEDEEFEGYEPQRALVVIGLVRNPAMTADSILRWASVPMHSVGLSYVLTGHGYVTKLIEKLQKELLREANNST